jgi:signal peptidase I
MSAVDPGSENSAEHSGASAPASRGSERRTKQRQGLLRTAIELSTCLVVLVVMFRAFLAGGYLIETGSMAPCLLGHHRRHQCPRCAWQFTVDSGRTPASAVCPNCGWEWNPGPEGTYHDGDHLLVHRLAFELRRPRRWEVLVFRNPGRPAQAFVKRVAGLPGETIEIRDGDLYVNGQIAAKSYDTQQGIRVPVYDHDFRPPDDDPEWQPRWVAAGPNSLWRSDAGAFRFRPAAAPDGKSPEIAWVTYRHWVRRGGTHKTSVPLGHWPAPVDHPDARLTALEFDEAAWFLICTGAMSLEVRNRLIAAGGDREFRLAIERLYEASHIAPVTDACGYNRDGGGGSNQVRDLMVSLELSAAPGPGLFVIALTDGTQEVHCELDFGERQIRLVDATTIKAMRTARFPQILEEGRATIDFSLVDRQALVAVDGVEVFETWSYPPPPARGPTPWQPIRFGAREISVDVNHLRLYRDVYYTADQRGRSKVFTWQLGPDEYFVLGDNSPVSKDSRTWPTHARLTHDLLIGKPLIVHLPSRRQPVKLGAYTAEIRIPELSRIRYIH